MGIFSILANEKRKAFGVVGIFLSFVIPFYAVVVSVTEEKIEYRYESVDLNTEEVIGYEIHKGQLNYYRKEKLNSSDRIRISESEYLLLTKQKVEPFGVSND